MMSKLMKQSDLVRLNTSIKKLNDITKMLTEFSFEVMITDGTQPSAEETTVDDVIIHFNNDETTINSRGLVDVGTEVIDDCLYLEEIRTFVDVGDILTKWFNALPNAINSGRRPIQLLTVDEKLSEEDMNHILNDEFFDIVKDKCGALIAHNLKQQVYDDMANRDIVNGEDVYEFYELISSLTLDDNLPRIGEKSPELRDMVAKGWNTPNVYYKAAVSINEGPLTYQQYINYHNQLVKLLEH